MTDLLAFPTSPTSPTCPTSPSPSPGPSPAEAESALASKGWVLFPAVLKPAQCAALRTAILQSVADCGERQVRSGAAAAPDGTAHHAVGQYPALDAFIAQLWLHDVVARFFGGAPFILHAFNPVSVAPAGRSYVHRVHRDVRTYAGPFRMMLNMLVMVDAFTLENGATHILSGSHREAEQPAEARFWPEAERMTGPAGSIALFDSNTWHAAGENRSDQVRTALTMSFSRAFIKQQMDYPRFLGPGYADRLDPAVRQLLGYHAMVPTSFEEFYRPREARLYQAEQG